MGGDSFNFKYRINYKFVAEGEDTVTHKECSNKSLINVVDIFKKN